MTSRLCKKHLCEKENDGMSWVMSRPLQSSSSRSIEAVSSNSVVRDYTIAGFSGKITAGRTRDCRSDVLEKQKRCLMWRIKDLICVSLNCLKQPCCKIWKQLCLIETQQVAPKYIYAVFLVCGFVQNVENLLGQLLATVNMRPDM